ncbi:CvfB family protein [Tuberibacillus sp. Marseille-P3662]|uniref:CvfB family protein n=1 Tax=Tuberibacillus sp. Marseille-P3662 TaxID=1965358 RepID=UPI000A1CA0E8|nr:S1-like domain-containing RNA-binding protein [Tuberibacillus sp. Marseille-P3662]
MEELHAGAVRTLYVEREVSFGYFLKSDNEEVLLHEYEIEDNIVEGDFVTVFLYHDKKGRLAATMTIPDVTFDTYQWLPVVTVKRKLGVFIDIGINKDILLSLDDLPDHNSMWPNVEDELYCALKLDKKGRLLAKLADEQEIATLAKDATSEMFNQDITATIYRMIPSGSFFITKDGIKGFIHHSERKQEPHLGEKVMGRIIEVKDDGTVNVSLLPRKQESIDTDAELIFSYLVNHGGSMPYGDRTSPDDIKAIFNMNKAPFKRALGRLMKEKKVYQQDGWTYVAGEKI